MNESRSEILLNECREFMTYRMRTSMSRMMGSVEDTLFEMATGECSTAQSSGYIDAVREIRMKKREIQVRFENRFMSLFDQSVRQIRQDGTNAHNSLPAGADASNIVNLNPSGRHAVESTVEKVRTDCREALARLDTHIISLLDTGTVDHIYNPMEPGMVFDAFWESCRDIQIGAEIRQVLVQMFEKYVAMDLQELYGDLNELFASYEAAGDRITDDLVSNGNRNARIGLQQGISTSKRSLLVRNWVIGKIRTRINDSEVEIPAFVSQFLLQQWCLLLEKIYEKNGDNSTEWLRAMQVVDDLIMSTLAVTDRDKRRQQLWKLPGLIYRLKNGMKTAAIPLKQQADFLSQLKAYHSSLSEFSPVSAMMR